MEWKMIKSYLKFVLFVAIEVVLFTVSGPLISSTSNIGVVIGTVALISCSVVVMLFYGKTLRIFIENLVDKKGDKNEKDV